MKNKIHHLADTSKKSGQIKFVHHDGTKRTFSTCVNRLSGDRLSWFDDCAPSINDESWVKSVFRDIRAKAKVISFIGDF